MSWRRTIWAGSGPTGGGFLTPTCHFPRCLAVEPIVVMAVIERVIVCLFFHVLLRTLRF